MRGIDRPTLSIVIVNWNTASLLEKCLEAVLRCVQKVEYELLVVDNGSEDGSAERARLRFGGCPFFRLIANRTNRGFAEANNQGFALSTGEWVALLNSDIILTPGSLEELVDYGRRHPEVGVVTCRLVDMDGTRQLYLRRFPDLWTVAFVFSPWGSRIDRLLLRRYFKRRYLMSDEPFDLAKVVEQAGAACVVLRREAIEAAGGLFDERFPVYFNDVDLCKRVWKAGFEIHALPVDIVHGGGKSLVQLSREERLYHFRAGLRAYYEKHHGALSRVLMRLVLGAAISRPLERLRVEGRSSSSVGHTA